MIHNEQIRCLIVSTAGCRRWASQDVIEALPIHAYGRCLGAKVILNPCVLRILYRKSDVLSLVRSTDSP